MDKIRSKGEYIRAKRVTGKTWTQIAEELEISASDLRTIYHQEVQRETSYLDTQEVRSFLELELERLDHLQAAHWQAAMYGDSKSTDAVLKIMAHRAKLLHLDSPDTEEIKQQILVVGSDSYLEKLVEAGAVLPQVG